jgi:UDP-N-acetyl-D-mannosaminuronic acid dehydrogenase
MKTICVVGLGYIGLPTASLFANQGFRVLGVDTNARVVDVINAKQTHIEEIGLRTLVEAAIGSGRMTASTQPGKADAFIIAVPTPFGDHKEPDLTFVFDAAKAILPHLQPGNLVVVESTVPPGTTEKVAEIIATQRKDLVKDKNNPLATLQIHLAHCPERVLPGKILKELVENDRVIGGLTEEATAVAIDIYKSIVSGTIYPTDATTAEMVKLSENTFRDINIAFANELAVICEKLGISVWDVIQLANKHPRVNILSPGPGVGGHCIAVDPWFIVAEFPEDAHLIRAARLRNDAMPGKVVEKIVQLVQGETRPKISLLGASYKGNVGDARNSPAIEIFERLRAKFGDGAEICINDMHVNDSKVPLQPLDTVLDRSSLLVVLVDHYEYKVLDPFEIGSKVHRKVVLDTRNLLNHTKWASAGFDVHVLGRGSEK